MKTRAPVMAQAGLTVLVGDASCDGAGGPGRRLDSGRPGRRTAGGGWTRDRDLWTAPLCVVKKLQRDVFRRLAGDFRGRIVDVGCGSGGWRQWLRVDHYVGVDLAVGVSPIIVGSGLALPFQAGTFDGAICTELLEHVPDPGAVLREIRRVLRADGRLYLTVPMSWGAHYEPHDYHRFTRHAIRAVVAAAGFRIVAVERIGGAFSLCGARMQDVAWQQVRSALGFVPVRWAERVATAVVNPGAIVVAMLAQGLDRLDQRDAIGWAVLAHVEGGVLR